MADDTSDPRTRVWNQQQAGQPPSYSPAGASPGPAGPVQYGENAFGPSVDENGNPLPGGGPVNLNSMLGVNGMTRDPGLNKLLQMHLAAMNIGDYRPQQAAAYQQMLQKVLNAYKPMNNVLGSMYGPAGQLDLNAGPAPVTPDMLAVGDVKRNGDTGFATTTGAPLSPTPNAAGTQRALSILNGGLPPGMPPPPGGMPGAPPRVPGAGMPGPLGVQASADAATTYPSQAGAVYMPPDQSQRPVSLRDALLRLSRGK